MNITAQSEWRTTLGLKRLAACEVVLSPIRKESRECRSSAQADYVSGAKVPPDKVKSPNSSYYHCYLSLPIVSITVIISIIIISVMCYYHYCYYHYY